jgi:hypothetical protein
MSIESCRVRRTNNNHICLLLLKHFFVSRSCSQSLLDVIDEKIADLNDGKRFFFLFVYCCVCLTFVVLFSGEQKFDVEGSIVGRHVHIYIYSNGLRFD